MQRRWCFLKCAFSASSHQVSQPCLLFPPQPEFSRPREFTLEARVVGRPETSASCSPRRPVPSTFRLCGDSSPLGATFVADSIWFHRASRRGPWGPLGRAHQSPTFGAIYKPLSEGVRARPRIGCSCYQHCLQRSGAFPPADLPASGEM